MNCRIKTVRADPNGWVTDKSARNGRQARRSGEREREMRVSAKEERSLLHGSFINRKSSGSSSSSRRGSLEWLSVSDLGVYDARLRCSLVFNDCPPIKAAHHPPLLNQELITWSEKKHNRGSSYPSWMRSDKKEFVSDRISGSSAVFMWLVLDLDGAKEKKIDWINSNGLLNRLVDNSHSRANHSSILFLLCVAVFRMTTMELEASLYHASDNISSIMSNSASGKSHENVGTRRRKVRSV